MRSLDLALIAAACFVWGTQSGAQELRCEMQDVACTAECAPLVIAFEINTSQFAAPQNPNDPPRRQVTQVQYGATSFVAAAIMMPGGIRGFHEDAGNLGSRLMIVQRSGDVRLTLQPSNQMLRGLCTRAPS